MKKYVYMYVLLAFMLIAGFILYSSFQRIPMRQEINMLAINEIVKSVEQNWHSTQNLNQLSFSYRACVIDNSGQLVWASDAVVADNLQDAMLRGYATPDVYEAGQAVGKVLIETNPTNLDSQANKQLARLSFITVTLLCAVSLLFLLGVDTIIIKPFKSLESFAHKISTGRFDEPLPMDKNNIFGLFTQSFDVMRESLLEARHSQITAEREKKELIASLSHDIKTPVTSIKLISELLLAKNPEPNVYEKLKTIEAKADHINHLMNDMLHSALEELGELKVNLTSESSEVLQSLIKNTDHYCKVRIGNIPQCLVDIDISRMEQVIGNIITNSYKYAGTGIDVICVLDNEFLRVEINDYGSGVEPDAVELICTKFYRGENAKTSQQDGEGLGLYVAKILMDKMDGGLEAYNRADGFGVRLMLRLSR